MAEETLVASAYEAFRPAIRRHLARLVGEADADDVTHEVFVKALGRLDVLRQAGSVRAWLYRVATNAAMDRLRRRARGEKAQDPLDEDSTLDLAGPESRHAVALPVESQAIRREMSECVRAVVGRLPAAQRIALVLSEFEGYSDAEIATLTGTSVGNVKIRLHRARARLRGELTRCCRIYTDGRSEVACEPVESLPGDPH